MVSADFSFGGVVKGLCSDAFFPLQQGAKHIYENRKEIAKEVSKLGLGIALAVGSNHVAHPIAAGVLRAAGAAGLTYTLVGCAFASVEKIIGVFSKTKAESFAKVHGGVRDAIFAKRHITLIAGVCVSLFLSPAVGGVILGMCTDSWKGERAQLKIQK